ncbi:GNAT family protein [Rhabdobacter roseus]|uniref:RimJ/RimL family protein N-acetyltransferase n=1 Tax=Rhabdobacter roseus TaxID=1655419 RepID=A0A840TR66_9BACT|nr:GNAT family N-acetyltransferase [Rhabdobacter roseus]MBB5285415.1 RimJ/RimL family protein N-acetyltransferase [Rhabdobacter roseus]
MLETPRLKIIPCDDTLFDAIRMGDGILGQVLGANVPRKWTQFRDAFAPAYLRWKAHPPLRDWWTYLIIYEPDNLLIGSCGYKGEPDDQGCVEIGYEIRASHRQKGLATEAAQALVQNALTYPEVKKILAHTMPEENPSARLLQKLGFVRIGEVDHPDEGVVWRWELTRNE